MGTPDAYAGISSVRNLELDRLYPGGWSLAYTRTDADKLYAGGITAVNPAGEVWEDDDDHVPDDADSRFGGSLVDKWTAHGSRFGHTGWEFRVVLTYDGDAHPETDGDWAGPDEIAAWKGDHWQYVNVSVTPVDSRGRVWEHDTAVLGAVVFGDIRPGDLDSPNIGRAVIERDILPDMITEAMNNAGRG